MTDKLRRAKSHNVPRRKSSGSALALSGGGGGFLGGLRLEKMQLGASKDPQRKKKARQKSKSDSDSESNSGKNEAEASEQLLRPNSVGQVTPRRVRAAPNANSLSARSSPVCSPRRHTLEKSLERSLVNGLGLPALQMAGDDRRAHSDGANSQMRAAMRSGLRLSGSLRREGSSGLATPLAKLSSESTDSSIIKSVVSTLLPRQTSTSSTSSSTFDPKQYTLVILLNDPLGMTQSHTSYFIPNSKLSDEDRAIFLACSVGRGVDTMDDDVVLPRRRAVHMLTNTTDVNMDFGQHRWPREPGKFAEYREKGNELQKTNGKCELFCCYYLVVWPTS